MVTATTTYSPRTTVEHRTAGGRTARRPLAGTPPPAWATTTLVMAPPDLPPTAGPLGAARAVAPVVAAGRAWAEEHARLAPGTVDALAMAGLFRLVAPREVGGWEAALPDQLAVYEELAAADPSPGA